MSGEVAFSVNELIALGRRFEVPVGAFFGEVPAQPLAAAV